MELFFADKLCMMPALRSSFDPRFFFFFGALFFVLKLPAVVGREEFVNVCVLIGDVQAGEVAYRRFAAIIDIAIKHANDLVLPPNITLRKYYLPEKPRRSGPCISSCTAARALDLLHSGANCHMFLGPGNYKKYKHNY